jgi:hypothetical protein
MKFILIANSEKSNSQIVINRTKRLSREENCNFIFFNRFTRNLKNPFWLNFIKTNTKCKFWFVSRKTHIANKQASLWGLHGEESICSEKYKLDKYFEKILVFNDEESNIFYHNCPDDVFKKIIHINNYQEINNTNISDPSTGLLMYLFIKKYYPESLIFLIGFTHEGWHNHYFDLQKLYFKSERQNNPNLINTKAYLLAKKGQIYLK